MLLNELIENILYIGTFCASYSNEYNQLGHKGCLR